MAPVLVLGAAVYLIARIRKPARARFLVLSIAICVAALVYYKYRSYLGSFLGLQESPNWKLGAIPLGISFFTFEFVHYLVELRKGGKPVSSPLEFGLFSIFFPSLVAGPIKRYGDFTGQLRKPAAFRPDWESLVLGGTRVLAGAAKKMMLADPLADLSDRLHEAALHGNGSAGFAWLLFFALALRIYFDFSGYSDMAIGTARMLNIRLPENFDWPYKARSIQEFWRRWHISLSTWIRDYVYIPLGGSRTGPWRRLANFLLAFTLCGLWHGAATHFALWGLWHGAGIGLERALQGVPAYGRLSAGWAGWIGTFVFVGLGWLLFFYPVEEAGRIALAMIGAG